MKRLFERLERKVQGLFARAIVQRTCAESKCQTLDVSLIANESKSAIEHMEAYGFTAHPHPGSEAIALFPDGDRSHALVVAVSDRRYRLQGLASGEVAVYDDIGHAVTLTRKGIVIDGGGHPITVTNALRARFEMDIEATGQITDLCDGNGLTMAAMRQAYNGHRHTGHGAGSATDQPDSPMGE